MAKCPICMTKKGKRTCLISDGLICSLCCGNVRKEESCASCNYYQPPKRKYHDIPRYTPNEMDKNPELDHYSQVLEGAIYSYHQQENIDDATAIAIYELLLDKYHFNDASPKSKNRLVNEGFNWLNIEIDKHLKKVPKENLIKAISLLRFVANRRTKTGREYMRVVEQFLGGVGDFQRL